jgi:hypothetical protein
VFICLFLCLFFELFAGEGFLNKIRLVISVSMRKTYVVPQLKSSLASTLLVFLGSIDFSPPKTQAVTGQYLSFE